MVTKVLIANRGEVAVRIARACRELGVTSVAVYSEADAGARHVRAADEAVCIGPAPSRDSYLSSAALIDAARQTGADAVHPGYGFLAENHAFAAECVAAGLIFVGPPPEVIRQMGSKIEARRAMAAAGVPVVPGEVPSDQSDAGVRRAIDAIGYPALVKASAGGGGKGMRLVRTAAEAAAAIASARREATAAFGDGALYVERLIEQPHHVEVQIMGDHHGGVVHLFERECSVQRRHQKVIEESPSPVVTPDLRRRITSAALSGARAVNYRNAGTMEFLVDADAAATDAPFYFLEMNTRLQVEHPVTEAVAGVDLVRAQLLIAAGGRLPWTQDELLQRGHAIEARVYAEDPAHDFLPQAGAVRLYREPQAPGVRVDSGVAEGDTIGVHYDPLMAKVIAHAETRDLARARLAAALRDFPILGVRTNIPFLLRVLEHPRFVAGTIDTGFLDRDEGPIHQPDSSIPALVSAAVDAHFAGGGERAGTSGAPVATGLSSAWDPWTRLRDRRIP